MIPVRQITEAKPNWIGVRYPFSECCFNADNTRILLVHGDGGRHGLYNGSGAFLNYPGIAASGEPAWHPTDPKLFYYIEENRLMRWVDGIRSLVRVFSEYDPITADGKNGITFGGETGLSDDGDHLPISNGDKTECFVFTLSTNTKAHVFKVTPFDGLKLSRSNQLVLSRDGDGIYVEEGEGWRKIVPRDAHAAITVDTDGSEILVWAQSDDINAITKTRLSDGVSTVLLDLGWSKPDARNSMSANISACDQKWVMVSLYGKDPTVKFANQILKVPLDGSGAEVICPTNSKASYYEAQPHAVLSRDGSCFLFSSNSGDDSIPHYCDVFMGILTAAHLPDLPPQPIFVDTDALIRENARLLQLLATVQAHDQQLAQDLAIAQSDALIARRDQRKAEAELEALHADEPDVVALRLALAKAQSNLRDCNHILQLSQDALSASSGVTPYADVWKRQTFSDFDHWWAFKAVSKDRIVMYDRWANGKETPVKLVVGSQYLFVAVSETEFEEYARIGNKT